MRPRRLRSWTRLRRELRRRVTLTSAAMMGVATLLLVLCSGTLVSPSPAPLDEIQHAPSGYNNNNFDHAPVDSPLPAGKEPASWRDSAAAGEYVAGDVTDLSSDDVTDLSSDESLVYQRHNRVLQFMDSDDLKHQGRDIFVNQFDQHIDIHSKIGDYNNNVNNDDDDVIKHPQPSPIIPTFHNTEERPLSPPSFADPSTPQIHKHDSSNPQIHRPSPLSDIQETLRTSQNVFKNNISISKPDTSSDKSSTVIEKPDLSRSRPEPRYPVIRGVQPLHNATEVPVKRLPQAIIIGAKKAGTRALLEYLRLHPGVVGAGPEPHFFDRNFDKGLDWYRSLMPRSYSDQLTLEKTPAYFITPEVPRLVKAMNPEVKILLVVRDPVTRAISDYVQQTLKRQLDSFESMAILDGRLGLINTSWAALKIGLYAKHMDNWMKVFPLHQIHIVDGHRLVTAPAQVMAEVEAFLGLPAFITEDHFFLKGFKGTFPCIMRGAAGAPHCLDEKTKGRDHPEVDPRVIDRLRDFYRPFNAKFYQMVGVNYGW